MQHCFDFFFLLNVSEFIYLGVKYSCSSFPIKWFAYGSKPQIHQSYRNTLSNILKSIEFQLIIITEATTNTVKGHLEVNI